MCSHIGRTTRRAVRSRVCFLFDPLPLRFLDYIFFLPPIIPLCNSGFWRLWVCMLHITMVFLLPLILGKDPKTWPLWMSKVHVSMGFVSAANCLYEGCRKLWLLWIRYARVSMCCSAADSLCARFRGFWRLWVCMMHMIMVFLLPLILG